MKFSMELTPEQQKTIEQLGGLHYSAEKVAMYLELDRAEFLAEFNTPETDPKYKTGNARYHYDRGLLLAQAEVDKANLKRARDGNLTSVAQFKKDVTIQNFENAKRRILYQDEKTQLDQLKGLIERGEVRELPAHMVEYFEQIDYIRGLYLRWQSKPFIINAVALKWPKMTKFKVGKLYNETLNFFYLDNEVKVESWRNIYAERLDNLAALAAEMNDIDQARRCLVDAAEIRGVNKDQPPQLPADLLDRRPIFYTIDIQKLGIPKIPRTVLADFIDKLELTELEKSKARREAMVEESPFELVIEDEENKD